MNQLDVFVDVFDGVLPDPMAYRAAVLAAPSADVSVGPATFHGIRPAPDDAVAVWLIERYPALVPQVSFCRQSPKGQEEPNFIHTDTDMGEWTAILYLTPDPPAGDGTTFWRHKETGMVLSAVGARDESPTEAMDWRRLDLWEPLATVEAKFNRLVSFPSALFHSRAIAENYGHGDDARLIQVVFGVGSYAQRYQVPVCQ